MDQINFHGVSGAVTAYNLHAVRGGIISKDLISFFHEVSAQAEGPISVDCQKIADALTKLKAVFDALEAVSKAL